MNERVITSKFMEEDIVNEYSLRPLKLSEYIGQDKVKDNLKVFIRILSLTFNGTDDYEHSDDDIFKISFWGCSLLTSFKNMEF